MTFNIYMNIVFVDFKRVSFFLAYYLLYFPNQYLVVKCKKKTNYLDEHFLD